MGVVQFSTFVGGDGTVVKLEVSDTLNLATTPHYHCHGLKLEMPQSV